MDQIHYFDVSGNLISMTSRTVADCTAEILFDPQIPTCGLLKVLERAGPVLKLELIISPGLAIAKATYQDAHRALLASRLGFVARTGSLNNPTNWVPPSRKRLAHLGQKFRV